MRLTVVLVLAAAVAVALSANAAPYCTFTYGTNSWDLSGIYKSTGNYRGTDGTYDYMMNVCGAVNGATGCSDKGYSVCEYSTAGGAFVASLGSFGSMTPWSLITLPGQPPEPAANGVQYTHTNGDICWIAGRQVVRTVLQVFRCATNTNQTFTVTEDQTTCTFVITLYTSAACQGRPTVPCSYSTGKYSWDLSSLAKPSPSNYKGADSDYDYLANVCASVNNRTGCTDKGYSVCQFSQGGATFIASLGSFSSLPTWSLITGGGGTPEPAENGVQYTMTNGDICWIAGRQQVRTVRHVFRCAGATSDRFSVEEDVTSCIYTLTFQTPAACQAAPPPKCGWQSGTYTYDLSSLTKTSGAYKGTDGTYDYLMNVCAAVEDGPQGGYCKSKGYSICEYSMAGGTFVASLGSFDVAPTWSFLTDTIGRQEPPENGVQYTMTNGDICWIAGRQQIRTVIHQFRCSSTSSGDSITVVEDQTTCTFVVTYKTPAACVQGPPGPTSCQFTDPTSQLRWDVSGLRKSTDYFNYVAPNNYTLNLCGDTAFTSGPCKSGSNSICQWSYRGDYLAGLGGFSRSPSGQWSLIAADPSVGAKITFTNGDPCMISGQQVARKSIVSFYCDPVGPRSFQVSADPDTCTYNFKWYVSEGCPHR